MESIQRALAAKGVYTDKIDGDYGKNSKDAARKVIATAAPTYKPEWSDDRVRLAFEQLMMRDAGIDVGGVDGVEGVMTQFGWEQFQNKMRKGPARGGLT
ncbi:MAG: hypothetical protein E6G94_10380, partial [Alphaproteobacteria bacterium]